MTLRDGVVVASISKSDSSRLQFFWRLVIMARVIASQVKALKIWHCFSSHQLDSSRFSKEQKAKSKINPEAADCLDARVLVSTRETRVWWSSL